MKRVLKMRRKLLTVFLVSIMMLVTFSSTASATEAINDAHVSATSATQDESSIEQLLCLEEDTALIIKISDKYTDSCLTYADKIGTQNVKQSGIYLIIYKLDNEWTVRLAVVCNANSVNEGNLSNGTTNDEDELPEPEKYDPPYYRPVPPPAAPEDDEDELPEPEKYDPPYYRPVPPPAAPEDDENEFPEPEKDDPPSNRCPLCPAVAY